MNSGADHFSYVLIWHEEQDRVLRTETLKKRSSVKHKPNSTRGTQLWCIKWTAQEDQGAQGTSTHEWTDQPVLTQISFSI